MGFLRENAWFFAVLAALAVVWLLGGTLAPFIMGVLAAYLLNPLAEWLAQRGWSRGLAALLLVFLSSAILIGGLVLLVPILIGEARDLLTVGPDLVQKAYQRFWRAVGPWAEQLGLEPDSMSGDIVAKATAAATQTLTSVTTGLLMAVDILFLAFLTPFVAFWLLRDWPTILDRARGLVPRRSAATVTRIGARLDRRLSGWIRGQSLVCLFQAVWHSVGLMLIGLESWLLIGVATGLASFVPVIGNLTLFIVALLAAFIQFETLPPVLAVVGIYAASQLLEETVLYPKLVGDRVDLHPLWVIFALLVAAALFGLPGALLAMPIACVAEVLVEWVTERYRASSFYRRA